MLFRSCLILLCAAVVHVSLALGPPVITAFAPNPTNAVERQQIQFECLGFGIPLPTFRIRKIVPVPVGFGGQSYQEYIKGPNGIQIGLRHVITKVTEQDAGAYACTVENKFGKDEKYLHVNVKRD